MEIPVVVIGHVDHGKSTLIGRILYDSKRIPHERMQELQAFVSESRIRFEFAYFLDALQEEIEQERTIDTVRVCFQSQRTYRIADVPGHREFVGNMLTGASDARIAILVLSGPDGPQAQTLQHLFLCQMLGVSHLLVALNKMDLAHFDSECFRKYSAQAKETLARFGFHNATIIPVAATLGDNIASPSPTMPWYQGPTLLQALDDIPHEEPCRPLRFAIQDNYQVDDQLLAVGRVESGQLRQHQTLTFPLSSTTLAVEQIHLFGSTKPLAEQGDCVGIPVPNALVRGDVGGPPQDPTRAITTGVAQVFVLDQSLSVGDSFELGGPFGQTPATVQTIEFPVDATSGQPLESPLHSLLAHQAGHVSFSCLPTCLEAFSSVRSLGRVVISKQGALVGFGIVQ